MEVFVLKIILTVSMFLLSILFGLLPIKVLKLLRKQAAASSAASARRWPSLVLCLLSCFSGGVFFGTCFLHLLPEVSHNCRILLKSFDYHADYPFAELVSCLGFFLVFTVEEVALFFIERHQMPNRTSCSSVVHIHVRHSQEVPERVVFRNADEEATKEKTDSMDESLCEDVKCTGIDLPVTAEPECCRSPANMETKNPPITMGFKPHAHSHGVRSVTLIIALSFHSVIEGVAMGVQTNNESAIALFLSIAIHKCVVAFGLGVQMARTHSHRLRMVLLSMLTFAVMTPLGSAVGIGVEQCDMHSTTKDLIIIVLEGLSVGTFMYVTFFEVLLHERDNEHSNRLKLLATFLGFVVIALMRIMGHGHDDHSHHHHHNGLLNQSVAENASSAFLA